MRAVIMAGGEGKRVQSASKGLPKILIDLAGKTVLEHQLETLRKEGINKVTFLLGHMSAPIISFLKKNNYFDMEISYVVESEPLGTAGSLCLISDLNEDFLLIFGDIIFDVFIDKFFQYHKAKGGIATLLVHPNDHPYDSDLVICDENAKVESFTMKNEKKTLYNNKVSAGLFILNPDIFEHLTPTKTDLVNDILPMLLSSHEEIYGYQSSEYVKDMGTPSRMKEVEKHLKSGMPNSRNLRKSQTAVFLDRDGVINKEVNQLVKIGDFELLDRTADAIRLLNNSDYLSIVVTNQPAVAKGFCDIKTIMDINRKMETILGNMGLKLDAIYVCPHHPEKGFPGENKDYKILCNCRKPAIGLFEKAKKIFNIDFSKSYMIGDSTRDIMAAKNAGLKSILVNTGYKGLDRNYDVTPDYISDNIYQAVRRIVG